MKVFMYKMPRYWKRKIGNQIYWKNNQKNDNNDSKPPKEPKKSNVPSIVKEIYIATYFFFAFLGMILTLALGKNDNGFAVFVVNLIFLGLPTMFLYGLLSTIYDYKNKKITYILLSLFIPFYLITGVNMVLLDIIALTDLPINETLETYIAFIVLMIIWLCILILFFFLLLYFHKKDVLIDEKQVEENKVQLKMDLSEIEKNEIIQPNKKIGRPKKIKDENEDMETKREKFIKLTELRVNRIMEDLRLLGNCANAYMYEYTDEDIDKIFNAIEEEISTCKKKFSGIKIQKFKL